MKKNHFLMLLFFQFMLAVSACSQTKQPDCNDAQGIKEFLEKHGFMASPTTVVGKADHLQSENVMDFADLIIKQDGLNINMAQPMELELEKVDEGFKMGVIITKNENFCDDNVSEIIFNDYNKANYDVSINIHIWDDPKSDNDLLFMRFNEVDFEKMGK